MSPAPQSKFDVIVIGGGATGLAAGLSAAVAGFAAAIFAPQAAFPAGRTAALMGASIALLSGMDVWPALARHAAPLRAIRLIDGSRRLLRAPEVTFHASEIGLPAFGFNVPNAELVSALHGHAEAFSGLTIFPVEAGAIVPESDAVRIIAGETSVCAKLVVGADGARSIAREAAGIAIRSWSHRQAALVATLSVEHPHGGVSTEFHMEGGPFTLVPLPGDRVSLVWVDRPARIEAMAALDSAALARVIEQEARFIYGSMRLDSAPARFPLRAALAERFSARRVMLVGEAAHLFPPIGAQGLNLGFRDVAVLRRVLTRFRDDPGSSEALDAYHAGRQGDVRSRALAVDVLNRSLLADFLPAQAVRGIGLSLAASIPPLRRALMRQGLGGSAASPQL